MSKGRRARSATNNWRLIVKRRSFFRQPLATPEEGPSGRFSLRLGVPSTGDVGHATHGVDSGPIVSRPGNRLER